MANLGQSILGLVVVNPVEEDGSPAFVETLRQCANSVGPVEVLAASNAKFATAKMQEAVTRFGRCTAVFMSVKCALLLPGPYGGSILAALKEWMSDVPIICWGDSKNGEIPQIKNCNVLLDWSHDIAASPTTTPRSRCCLPAPFSAPQVRGLLRMLQKGDISPESKIKIGQPSKDGIQGAENIDFGDNAAFIAAGIPIFDWEGGKDTLDLGALHISLKKDSKEKSFIPAFGKKESRPKISFFATETTRIKQLTEEVRLRKEREKGQAARNRPTTSRPGEAGMAPLDRVSAASSVAMWNELAEKTKSPAAQRPPEFRRAADTFERSNLATESFSSIQDFSIYGGPSGPAQASIPSMSHFHLNMNNQSPTQTSNFTFPHQLSMPSQREGEPLAFRQSSLPVGSLLLPEACSPAELGRTESSPPFEEVEQLLSKARETLGGSDSGNPKELLAALASELQRLQELVQEKRRAKGESAVISS